MITPAPQSTGGLAGAYMRRECISLPFEKFTTAHEIKNQFFIHESLIVPQRFACNSRHEEIHIGLNGVVVSDSNRWTPILRSKTFEAY